MARRSSEEAPKVNFDVALRKFISVMKRIYTEKGMTLPEELFVSDSFVEAEMGLNRFYGGTSDIDILAPEPEGLSSQEIGKLETQIRNSLGESGVDFNFADIEDLRRGDAYGRPCRPIPRFSW